MASKHIKTKEQFIERANEKHQGFYSYELVEFPKRGPGLSYKGSRTRKLAEYYREAEIVITCPKHGPFTQRARKHLEGHGCPKCANEKTGRALRGRPATGRAKRKKNNTNQSHVRATVKIPLHGPTHPHPETLPRIFNFEKANDYSNEFQDRIEVYYTPNDNKERTIFLSKEDKDILDLVYIRTTGHQESRTGRTDYAVAYKSIKLLNDANYDWLGGDGKIHRIIVSRMLGRPLEVNEVVDHINGNGLDNRRENLRLVNHSDQQINRAKQRTWHGETCSSQYKGVCKIPDTAERVNRRGLFFASTKQKGVGKINIGYCRTEEEAAEAYDREICKRWKILENSNQLNFPERMEEYLEDIQEGRTGPKPIEGLKANLVSKRNSTGYLGVVYRKERKSKQWVAQKISNGERIFWRSYSTIEEAAEAYDRVATEFFDLQPHQLEFELNFPERWQEYLQDLANGLSLISEYRNRTRRPRGNTKSKFRGVSYLSKKKSASAKKWLARIFHEHKTMDLGCYSTEEKAARAYDKAAKELKGDKAILNFPNS